MPIKFVRGMSELKPAWLLTLFELLDRGSSLRQFNSSGLEQWISDTCNRQHKQRGNERWEI